MGKTHPEIIKRREKIPQKTGKNVGENDLEDNVILLMKIRGTETAFGIFDII
jgi:hypothetical protein